MSVRAHLVRALRSRRVAIWLLIGIVAYVAILTVLEIPMPYSNPVFLLAGAWLTASTAACAWERTRAAHRSSPARMRAARQGSHRGLPTPTFEVPLSGMTESAAMEIAENAFRAAGMRTVLRDDLVLGWSNAWARWGSPVFHWALAAVFILAALGQLMKAEGLTNVVVGGSVADEAASYAVGSPSGPLFLGRYTGARIRVESLRFGLIAGGADRGDSPLVTVTSGGREVAHTYVYPNSPAQWGPLAIHRDAIGPAVLAVLRFPNGQEASATVFLPPSSTDSSTDAAATAVGSFQYTKQETGERTVVEAAQVPGKRVAVRVRASGFVSSPLAVGGSARLPDGTEITVSKLTAYARLRVVNDWTVPYIFTAFALVILAPLVSILWPPRRAAAAIVLREPGTGMDGAAGPDAILAVRVFQRRSDPAFTGRVRKAVSRAVESRRRAEAAAGSSDRTEERP